MNEELWKVDETKRGKRENPKRYPRNLEFDHHKYNCAIVKTNELPRRLLFNVKL